MILNDGLYSSCEDAGAVSLSKNHCQDANRLLASAVAWKDPPKHQMIQCDGEDAPWESGDESGDESCMISPYPLKCILVQTVGSGHSADDENPYDTEYGDITKFAYTDYTEQTVDGVKCGRKHCVDPDEMAIAKGALPEDEDFPDECFGLSNRVMNHFSCVCRASP